MSQEVTVQNAARRQAGREERKAMRDAFDPEERGARWSNEVGEQFFVRRISIFF